MSDTPTPSPIQREDMETALRDVFNPEVWPVIPRCVNAEHGCTMFLWTMWGPQIEFLLRGESYEILGPVEES